MSYGTKAANDIRRGANMTPIDTGPPERANHGGGVVVAEREFLDVGGITSTTGTQATFECVLDALLGHDASRGLLAGTQGSKPDRAAVARSRYEAGMKLRRLFIDAGLVGVRAFDPNGRGGGLGDLTDKQALARRAYNDLLKRMGPLGMQASGPCCFDQFFPDNDRWLGNIRRALDELCMVVL